MFAYLLSFARGLITAVEHQERGRWRHFPTPELQGPTVCIVGLGPIESRVTEGLNPFGVTTVKIRRDATKGGDTEPEYQNQVTDGEDEQ